MIQILIKNALFEAAVYSYRKQLQIMHVDGEAADAAIRIGRDVWYRTGGSPQTAITLALSGLGFVGFMLSGRGRPEPEPNPEDADVDAENQGE